MERKAFHRAALALASALVMSAAANAEPIDANALRHMTPRQVKAWAMKQIAAQQGRSAVQSPSGGDKTEPVFTQFSSALSVDVTRADNPLRVEIKATDDLSGVIYGSALAHGPDGQYVDVTFQAGMPAKKLSATMHSQGLSSFLEPGTYTFDFAILMDMADNIHFYDAAGLAALGKNTFTVKNNRGFDNVAPTLQGGEIMTPQASLSGRQRGTKLLPSIGVRLELADTGNTAVSGVRFANVDFCTLDQSNCFNLYSPETNEPRRNSISMLNGRSLESFDQPGEYHLKSINMSDYGGNYVTLNSIEFGGETDFGALFPSTTITITP